MLALISPVSRAFLLRLQNASRCPGFASTFGGRCPLSGRCHGESPLPLSHWSACATWQVLAVPWGQKRGLLSGVSPQGRHPSLAAPAFFLPTSCPPNSKGARPGNLISNHIHTLTVFATLVNFLFFPGLWFPKDETGQWGLSHGKLRSLPSLTISVPWAWHSLSRETWSGFVVRTS